jgi:hypothetical protein
MAVKIFRPNEDNCFFLMDRIYGTSATVVTQATISSIAYKITRMDTESTVDSGSLVVATVIFDTLQTAEWLEDDKVTAIDSTGYNFGWWVTADKLTVGGIQYIADVTFTPTTGTGYNFSTAFRLETKKRYN